MAKAPAFQFYAGDFLNDTTTWSEVEVAVHIRLMAWSWLNGGVPTEFEPMCRISESAKKVWKTVGKKWVEHEGMYFNPKLEECRAKQQAFAERQREKSKLGVEARKVSGLPMDKPTGQPTGHPAQGDPFRSRSRSVDSEKERATPKPTEGFDEFWAVYPSGKAKADAVKAWGKLRADERALCIPAIVAQIKSNHFRGHDGKDYVPYASSWLNARRWEDEIKTPVLNINGGMTKEEADEEMRQIRIKHGRHPENGWVGDEECSRALLIYMGRIKERKAS